MPYKFTFDLSRISQLFFTEITRISYEKRIHEKLSLALMELIQKFKIQEATGLNLTDAIRLLEDLVDTEFRNIIERDKFRKAKKKAVFLPHCARKYMDSRCKAMFNPEIPSYICSRCSLDCLIRKATEMAEGYKCDVYILPGGSCISRIIRSKHYEGVIGVACGDELKLAGEVLSRVKIAGQAIPLLKNGCANTFFDIERLQRILDEANWENKDEKEAKFT